MKCCWFKFLCLLCSFVKTYVFNEQLQSTKSHMWVGNTKPKRHIVMLWFLILFTDPSNWFVVILIWKKTLRMSERSQISNCHQLAILCARLLGQHFGGSPRNARVHPERVRLVPHTAAQAQQPPCLLQPPWPPCEARRVVNGSPRQKHSRTT